MRRTSFLLILVGLCATPVFSGGNPDDIDFKIRFVEDKSFFSHRRNRSKSKFRTQRRSKNKYLGELDFTKSGARGRSSNSHTDRWSARSSRCARLHGFFRAPFLSSIGFLGFHSRSHSDWKLADWYRFQKPGHYVVIVRSGEVSRAKARRGRRRTGALITGIQSAGILTLLQQILPGACPKLAEIERILENKEKPRAITVRCIA